MNMKICTKSRCPKRHCPVYIMRIRAMSSFIFSYFVLRSASHSPQPNILRFRPRIRTSSSFRSTGADCLNALP